MENDKLCFPFTISVLLNFISEISECLTHENIRATHYKVLIRGYIHNLLHEDLSNLHSFSQTCMLGYSIFLSFVTTTRDTCIQCTDVSFLLKIVILRFLAAFSSLRVSQTIMFCELSAKSLIILFFFSSQKVGKRFSFYSFL